MIHLQNPDVEERELKVPTLSQEMSSYAKHSDRFDNAGEMVTAEKSQKNRGSQDDDKEDEETLNPPLPPLDKLHELSKRLKTAIEASVLARKKQKVR